MKTADSYSAEDLAKVRLDRDRAIENSVSATAAVKAQRASVAEIRLRLEAASIRAPFRGVVAARFQTPGSWLDVGAPVLRIVGEGGAWVRFAAPPRVGPCVAPRSRIAVRIPGLAAELGGTVHNVSPEIDPASGMLTIEASLETTSATARLHSGLAVRVRPVGSGER
jgi:membrane fusion protein (multidrug efflux system)/multidrug efflux system membrane fusion protein